MKKLVAKIFSLPMAQSSVLPLVLLLVLWTCLGLLPIFDQSIVAAKYLAVILAGLIVLTWYLLHSLKKGTLSFVKTPFTLPLALLTVVTLVSLLANNAFPVESLLNLGGVLIALALLVLAGGLLVKRSELPQPTAITAKLLGALGLSTTILLITTLLQQFGYGPAIVFNQLLGLNLPNNLLFNLSGSNLVALQIALLTGAGFATKVIMGKKAKPWESLVLAVSAVSVVYYSWLLMPGKATTPVILSPTASWSVAITSLQNLKTTLLGVGPDNYIQAFNLNKPTWINNTEYWSVQFSQAANWPLSIVVSLGLFGLIAWIYLLINTLKQTKAVTSATKPLQVMLIVGFLLQLVVPINIVLLTLQAVIMLFWIANEKEHLTVYSLNLKGILAKNQILARKSHLISRLIIGLLTISSLALIALVVVAAYSSHLMYRSVKAATSNDFVRAYSIQQQAIKLNPYLDANRRKYAVTNIVIAAALSQKADLTEEDKQRFAQLIQQAIRESKAAILLDGKDLANWQLAAQIYQTLIGVAENSEEWTTKAYAEAIRLAPSNPELRLVLGGVLFNGQQYEEALGMFEQAAILKPNYANAYYNGANTLRLLRKFDEAKLAYQKTLMLLQPDSEDYLRAADELQVLEQIAREAINQQSPEIETNNLPVVNPVEDVNPEVEAPPVSAADDQPSADNPSTP